MEQTAVEWLIKELKDFGYYTYNLEKLCEQAKEMEKEQLREAFKQSRQAKIFEKDIPPVYESFEEWFEQFKNK